MTFRDFALITSSRAWAIWGTIVLWLVDAAAAAEHENQRSVDDAGLLTHVADISSRDTPTSLDQLKGFVDAKSVEAKALFFVKRNILLLRPQSLFFLFFFLETCFLRHRPCEGFSTTMNRLVP